MVHHFGDEKARLIVELCKHLMDNKPKPTRTKNEYSDEFQRLWQVYPRKVAIGEAYKVFNRIRPSAEMLETMIKAVQQQARTDQWKKDKGSFIPHLATWLNQKRWNDEVSTDQMKSKQDDIEKNRRYERQYEEHKQQYSQWLKEQDAESVRGFIKRWPDWKNIRLVKELRQDVNIDDITKGLK
jgi:hypothetical protein